MVGQSYDERQWADCAPRGVVSGAAFSSPVTVRALNIRFVEAAFA
jgi:hypothetical protein